MKQSLQLTISLELQSLVMQSIRSYAAQQIRNAADSYIINNLFV